MAVKSVGVASGSVDPAPLIAVPADRDRPGSAEKPLTTAYLCYALSLLLFVNVVNYADRSVVSVLIESIKTDIHLTDTQVGLLSGFAFALFYAVAGIMLARIADRSDRRMLLSVCIVAWSVMTAATGAATSFLVFFLVRTGVGIGEAGTYPTCSALIADYFSPARRAFAFGLYTAGAYIGITCGSMMGGYVNAHYGWRMAFVAAALPGLPLACLLRFTLRNPPRPIAVAGGTGQQVPVGEMLRELAANRAYLWLITAMAFVAFAVFGLSAWLPTFLIRFHKMDMIAVGVSVGTAVGGGTAFGSIVGGMINSMLVVRDLRWLTRCPMLMSLLLMPVYELAIYAQTPSSALLLVALGCAIAGSVMGPGNAAIQTVLPAHLRATGASIAGFLSSLIGLGGAPVLIGMLSDHYASSANTGVALQHALGISMIGASLVAITYVPAHRAFCTAVMGEPA
jgi:MFS family permease